MRLTLILLLTPLLTPLLTTAALAAPGGAVDGLLSGYRAEGASDFVAARAATMWSATTPAPDGGPARSCTSCHPVDMRAAGQHVRTGEAIEALSPSVTADRLSDPAEVEKWFARNCKWTLGRACTPQEKGDFLVLIQGAK